METNSSAHPARRILIGRIETLAIGQTDAALGFEGRLAAENGWTEAFAARVGREYRRFLALMAVSDEPLTPSDAVDQAWHLHMVYTRDYWHGLCRDIVGHDIHHEPTSGGEDRREHYRRRYARTLDLYRTTFDAAPPTDIWPDPSERFSGRFQRVDLGRTMIFPVERTKWIGLGFAGLAVAIASASRGQVFVLMVGLALFCFGRTSAATTGKMRRRDKSGSGGCSADASGACGSDGGGTDCGDGGCGGGGCGGGGCGGGCGGG